MKKALLLSGLLLLVGIGSTKAQMNEKFNDGKIPSGWFADGWTVKDNAAQKGSNSQGFDMGSLMGGSSDFSYLMTPPLKVNGGEKLSFSAKKSTGGSSSFMGDSDSTFVVERSVYGQHKWIQVADLTTELDTLYKTFTISDTEAGEYRFRFRSGGTVLIDSVAGFNIDQNAPDILVVDTVGRKHGVAVKTIDFGHCKADSTMSLLVINTATGTLKVDNTTASPFRFDKGSLDVASGDSLEVKITFAFQNGKQGKNEALTTFKPKDTRVEGLEIKTYAIVTEPDVWVENFNAEKAPLAWIGDGWNIGNGVATVAEAGGGGMFGGGASYTLTTPPLTIGGESQALIFSVKNGDGGGGTGSFMGGGSTPSITIEKSVYGSNKWEKVKTISDIDSLYLDKWVSGIEAGDYRLRFVASDSLVIDSVAGYKVKQNAPDMYITYNEKPTNYVFYGLKKANHIEKLNIFNSGTGTLEVDILSSNNDIFKVKQESVSIPAGESTDVEIELIYDKAIYGENIASIQFQALGNVLVPQYVTVRGYKISNEAWSEDFEPEYVVEDESEPRELPEGWETTGWQVTKPSGGMMEMFGGGGEPKTWMATTESGDYELITPRLQATQGEVMSFDVEFDSMGSMMSMFGGDSEPSMLNVYYRRDVDSDWTLYNTLVQTETVYFKAPYSGIYQLKFIGNGGMLDNFLGFSIPAEPVKMYEKYDNQIIADEYNNKVVNIEYDRELSAVQDRDGKWQSRAFTVCLPYDFNYTAYYPKEQVGVYKLEYVDDFYNEFIFNKTDGNVAAGEACLVVVNEGSVRLNAVQTLVTNQPKVSEVYAYGEEQPTVVGTWQGIFDNTAAEDEKLTNAFVMDDDGLWKPFPAGMYMLSLRSFFKKNEASDKNYKPMTRQAINPKKAPSKLMAAPNDEEHDGLVKFPAELFWGDLKGEVGPTEIGTIHTIDQDGTHRYYDMQGRLLNGKPNKGIYIINGKKYSK